MNTMNDIGDQFQIARSLCISMLITMFLCFALLSLEANSLLLANFQVKSLLFTLLTRHFLFNVPKR